MSVKHITAVVIIMLSLAGCALKNEPTPLGDSELVGYWLHDQKENIAEGVLHTRMALDITQEGYASYHFISCLESDGTWEKSRGLHLQHMPIIKASTKKIKVQTFPLTPKWEFQITKWPYQEDNLWRMVIDKKSLDRIEAKDDANNWQCES
ncbi:hypothetical protein A9Q99_16685 [Gammaproteobacteria bacterium 45_16_T64]|nr:hypothetical protein A9Q99_16685 [Gammaproteobacteria bacterium 45_16_T64]